MKKCREDEANHLFILYPVLYSPDTLHTNTARDTLTATHHRHKRAKRLAVFRLTVSIKFID